MSVKGNDFFKKESIGRIAASLLLLCIFSKEKKERQTVVPCFLRMVFLPCRPWFDIWLIDKFLGHSTFTRLVQYLRTMGNMEIDVPLVLMGLERWKDGTFLSAVFLLSFCSNTASYQIGLLTLQR